VGCKERAGSRSAPAPRLVNCKMPVTRLSIGGKLPSPIRSASAGAAGFAFGVLRFVVGAVGLARAVSVIVVIVRVLVARGVGLGLLVVGRCALDVRRLGLAGALSPAKPAFASKPDPADAPELAGDPDLAGELPLDRVPPLARAPSTGDAPLDEAGEDWRLVVFAGARGVLFALGERALDVGG